MKLSPDAIRRRRHTQALVFAAGAGTLVVGPWTWTRGRGPALVLLGVSLCACALAHRTPTHDAAGRVVRRLAARPLVSAALVGMLVLAASVAVALRHGVPVPSVHDEFSYLLAADTFAHGRLTNPTHPMWIHFEAPHILLQPTYMSKYPPAQGLILALGQVVLGHPIAGVWLGAALACGALTWMLAGWMPGRWALAGGLLSVAHPLTFGWTRGYWGGLVAVLGGALLLGALGRLVRGPRARHAAVLGVGLGILANSRPYEGFALAVPLGLALAAWLLGRRGPPAAITLTRLVLPLGAVLLAVGGGMLYYNYRVTGDPLALPYAVHQRAYATTPLLIFQAPLPTPEYRHGQLRRFFNGEPPHPPVRTLGGLAASARTRAVDYAEEYFGSLLVAVLVLLLFPLERNGWQLLLVLTLLLFTAALGLQSWRLPHYAAPAGGLALLVTMRAMRHVGRWRLGRARVGRALAQAVFVVALGMLALGWLRAARVEPHPSWHYVRARIVADLARTGEKHLVIVRYTPEHFVHAEWVYNAADIDAAPVVWADEMHPAANARLLEYFRDRRAWLVEPDGPGVRAVPYVAAAAP